MTGSLGGCDDERFRLTLSQMPGEPPRIAGLFVLVSQPDSSDHVSYSTAIRGMQRTSPSMSKTERERNLAVFIDLENLAMGFQGQRKIRFEMQKVLERLVEKGKLIVKKAYADWSRYQQLHRAVPRIGHRADRDPQAVQTGKNSADIRLVVDAMDLAWSKPHVDTFVIVSGDSDFSPLVSKLKENGKHVIGLGMKGSTSDLLRDNCDEFIYYEDLERQEQNEQQLATNLSTYLPPSLTEKQREVFSLLVEACNALRRENHEVLYASMIKDTMKRKKPSFDESYYGYRSFTHLLEDADNLALVDIERNPKSGTYVVTRICGEGEDRAPGTPSSPPKPPRCRGSLAGDSQRPEGEGRDRPPALSVRRTFGRPGARLAYSTERLGRGVFPWVRS